MRTIVYIDGFNLYYGSLKDTSYRWLNLERLCRLLLPRYDVQHINYFTAKVSGRPGNVDAPIRQELYLRALKTLSTVSITLGHFLSHKVQMPLANPSANGPYFATVIKTEEKGSDVNLATQLPVDACHDKFDVAIVITNDSDLKEPIRIVSRQFGKVVGIVNPQPHPSAELQQHAQFVRPIRKGVLAASQFPPTLTDVRGTFHKPVKW
ncbi:MAG: NYN domain-containing protein [Chloroflexota bacterium]|nr:NYN domain-containing protein [Chloroflexota bacterium]